MFWHCSFSRGRWVVTLFEKRLCFECQCANQVLGKCRHKRLSHCFSTFLQKLSSSCMHIHFARINPPSVTEFVKHKVIFPRIFAWIIFFPASFQSGRSAKEFVCWDVCESVAGCMFYSSLHFQTGDVVPSRHDSGASVPLRTLVFLKNPLSHLTVLLSGATV